jgi:hypothetical protein
VNHANRISEQSHTAFASLKETSNQSEVALQLESKTKKQRYSDELQGLGKIHAGNMAQERQRLEIEYEKKLSDRIREEMINYSDKTKALNLELEHARAATVAAKAKAKDHQNNHVAQELEMQTQLAVDGLEVQNELSHQIEMGYSMDKLAGLAQGIHQEVPKAGSPEGFRSRKQTAQFKHGKRLSELAESETVKDTVQYPSVHDTLLFMADIVSNDKTMAQEVKHDKEVPLSRKRSKQIDEVYEIESSPPSDSQSQLGFKMPMFASFAHPPSTGERREPPSAGLTRLLTPNGIDENRSELLMTADAHVLAMPMPMRPPSRHKRTRTTMLDIENLMLQKIPAAPPASENISQITRGPLPSSPLLSTRGSIGDESILAAKSRCKIQRANLGEGRREPETQDTQATFFSGLEPVSDIDLFASYPQGKSASSEFDPHADFNQLLGEINMTPSENAPAGYQDAISEKSQGTDGQQVANRTKLARQGTKRKVVTGATNKSRRAASTLNSQASDLDVSIEPPAKKARKGMKPHVVGDPRRMTSRSNAPNDSSIPPSQNNIKGKSGGRNMVGMSARFAAELGN